VRKFLEGAIANNVDHLGAVLTADFVFRFGARSVLAGSHRGIEGLSRLFTKYDENIAETPHGECFDTTSSATTTAAVRIRLCSAESWDWFLA
jgi:hypothetical protein